jgi:hypothetical protein
MLFIKIDPKLIFTGPTWIFLSYSPVKLAEQSLISEWDFGTLGNFFLGF